MQHLIESKKVIAVIISIYMNRWTFRVNSLWVNKGAPNSRKNNAVISLDEQFDTLQVFFATAIFVSNNIM